MKPQLTTILFSIFQVVYNPDHVNENTLRVIPYAEAEFGYADTRTGRVKGLRQLSRGGNLYLHFRGIPYAKPPVGELRFEPPVPHPNWDETLEAIRYKDDCPQINAMFRATSVYGKEDCLFINVATQKTYFKSDTPTKKFRPVIVWIHGGHFMIGSSHAYSPRYWMEEDIVFVTFNYRLGALGFLNTGEGTVAGNMGLKDQVLALKWIQDNIRFFNGDPHRVYLLGHSAGAVAAHMHTLSPMSRNLFAGAVSMGGTALSPWGLISNPGEQAVEMAKALKCEPVKKKKMLKCLRNLPVEAIADYHLNYFGQEFVGQRGYFGPTIETVEFEKEPAFLPKHPLELLKEESIFNVPWVNSVNSGDGIAALISLMKDENLRDILATDWNTYAPAILFYRNHPNATKLSKRVRKYYLNNQIISMSTLKNATDMTSDRLFFLDSHNAALLHSKVAPVYSYYYDYQGQYSFSVLTEGGGGTDPFSMTMTQGEHLFGRTMSLDVMPKIGRFVCHGDELPLMFSILHLRQDIEMPDPDYDISRKLIRLWVTFARTGTPNLTDIGVESVKWKTIKETNKQLDDVPLKRLIVSDSFSIAKEPFFDRMQVWKEYNVQEEMYKVQKPEEESSHE